MKENLSARPKTKTFALVQRILKNYVAPHSGRVALATFFMVVSAGLTAAFAVMIEPVIDDVLTEGKHRHASQ